MKLPEALRRRIERHRLLFVGDRAQNLVSAISALHFFGQELRELVLRGPDSAPATTLLPASDTEEALGILDDIEAVAATLASANWLNVWGGLGVLNTTGPARLAWLFQCMKALEFAGSFEQSGSLSESQLPLRCTPALLLDTLGVASRVVRTATGSPSAFRFEVLGDPPTYVDLVVEAPCVAMTDELAESIRQGSALPEVEAGCLHDVCLTLTLDQCREIIRAFGGELAVEVEAGRMAVRVRVAVASEPHKEPPLGHDGLPPSLP